MKTFHKMLLGILAVILSLPLSIRTQSFLKTTSDELLKPGNISFTLKSTYLKDTIGFDYQRRADMTISGPTAQFIFGISPRADFELSWDILRYTKIENTGSFTDIADVSFFTKIKLFQENIFPSLALRIGAKLPNASEETFTGTDESDIFMYGISGKHIGQFHVLTNIGLEILGQANGQNDALGYGLVFSYPFTQKWFLVSEIQGRYEIPSSPVNQAVFRGGVAFLYYSWKIDLGISRGLISQSEFAGLAGGITKTFDVF